MSDHQVKVHEVEYLASGAGTTGNPPTEQRIIVITIRPDEGSFRPHNLGIPRSSAERLLTDLQTIFSRSAVCLLLLLVVAGCSADVEVEHEKTSSRPEAADVLSTERTRTAVAVEMFKDQDGRPVDLPFEGTLVVEGCIHFHETLVIYLNEGDRNSERAALEIVREWSGGDCGRGRR